MNLTKETFLEDTLQFRMSSIKTSNNTEYNNMPVSIQVGTFAKFSLTNHCADLPNVNNDKNDIE